MITRAEQLSLIEKNINQVTQYTYFVLGKDISLQGIDYTPIGTSTAFAGQFNGKGHTISGLTMVNNYKSYSGIFASISDTGIVYNLNVENLTINQLYSSGYTAGIAAENKGVVLNCHVQGLIKSWNGCGGIVGINYGKIYCSSFTGTCSSSSTLGGLVSSNTRDGLIDSCYSQGECRSESEVGGLIGENYGKVYNCFATGSIEGNYGYKGGLVGRSESGYFENCYTSTLVSGANYDNNTNCGAIIGYGSQIILRNCYANRDIKSNWGNNEGTRVGCKLLTTQQMKTNEFVQLLNNNIANSNFERWTRSNDVNQGFPCFEY